MSGGRGGPPRPLGRTQTAAMERCGASVDPPGLTKTASSGHRPRASITAGGAGRRTLSAAPDTDRGGREDDPGRPGTTRGRDGSSV